MSDDGHTPTFHTYINGKSLTPTGGMLTCPDCDGGLRDGAVCATCGGTGKIDAPAGVNLMASDPLERIWLRLDHLERLIEDIGVRLRDSVNNASMSLWHTPIWRTSTIVTPERKRHTLVWTFLGAVAGLAFMTLLFGIFLIVSLPNLPHFGAPVLADNATATITATAPTLTLEPSATVDSGGVLVLKTPTAALTATPHGMPTATPLPPVLNLAPDPSIGLSLVCSRSATALLSIGNAGNSPLLWTASSREAYPGSYYPLNGGQSASSEVDPGDAAQNVTVTAIQYSGTITIKPAPNATMYEQFTATTLAVTCVTPTPTALPTATPTATPTAGM